MEDYRININYAKALFLVAAETGQLEPVNADMRLVRQVCIENHILNVVMANPVIREDKKVAILNDLYAERVCRVTSLFLTFVVKKRRAINLKGIADAFIDLYRSNHNIVLSKLVTAVDPDSATLDAVRQAVGEHTHMEVDLEHTVDPSILGGFSVSFNNNMYDARLSSQMAKLRKEFSKNVYESKL